ncbi:MAG: patatin-like phospholipase family protein [Bacteroidota bacterium]
MNFAKPKKKKEKEFKYGLVLSGGGTRGLAHLGVLKALEEENIKPEIISGVSAGSVVGALYADGMAPEEILEALASQKILKFIDFTIPRTGFVKMTGFERFLNKLLKAKRIEDLKTRLLVFTVNINSAEYVCFEEGPLIQIIKASSSIPILFPPVEIEKQFHCDGGLFNNFPVESLENRCERVIGVNVNPLVKKEKIGSLRKLAERTFQLNIRSHTIERKYKCNLFIEPEGLDRYSLLDLGSARETFELGYQATKKALKETDWQMRTPLENEAKFVVKKL